MSTKYYINKVPLSVTSCDKRNKHFFLVNGGDFYDILSVNTEQHL